MEALQHCKNIAPNNSEMNRTKGLNQLATGAITRDEFSAIERKRELLQISRSAMVRECITFYLANHQTTEYLQTAKSAS